MEQRVASRSSSWSVISFSAVSSLDVAVQPYAKSVRMIIQITTSAATEVTPRFNASSMTIMNYFWVAPPSTAGEVTGCAVLRLGHSIIDTSWKIASGAAKAMALNWASDITAGGNFLSGYGGASSASTAIPSSIGFQVTTGTMTGDVRLEITI